MRNIHVLPTLQPSRLWFHKLNRNLGFSDLPMEYNGSGTWVEGRNIYITSDKEIKDGDWVYNLKNMDILRYQESDMTRSFYKFGWRKIILTTDTDLIKDGVQAIPDEFLEWFFKNPSCEMIYVNKIESFDFEIDKYVYNYKIIIPKEEPKKHIVVLDGKDAVKEGFKQETLKEVAKRLSNTTDEFNQFVAGAKWQQEQDKTKYSEEEVYGMLEKLRLEFKVGVQKWQEDFEFDLDKFFEQFKKKS
jgi:hypothetical protein